VEAEEYARLDKIWNFQQFKEELPMCVVVPGYNNNAKFRIEYNLNSIFQQNYTNYFVVVINDASTDNSDELYRKYFDFYQISKDSYAYVENKERKTALENIYIATHEYCSTDSIVLNLDADDEFIGKNVLKTFNAGYQQFKSGVAYSNFFWYEQGENVMLGFTSDYTDKEKEYRKYRQAPQRFSHLRSYRTELFLKIKKEDFQDKDGNFWTSAYDMVMYFPLMELSCGRVNKIDGFHYLYNINTGLNDYAVDNTKQNKIDQVLRRGDRYDCSV
jgi:glycosyltransferase involved in cell wall biosynthesis